MYKITTSVATSFAALVLIALGSVVVFSAPRTSAAVLDVEAAETRLEVQTRVFAIENMTCAACPFTVKKAMSRVQGVKEVTVDFDAKTATAVFDAAVVSVDAIASASTDVGYPATLIEGE